MKYLNGVLNTMNRIFSFFSRKKNQSKTKRVVVDFNYTESIVCAKDFYGPSKKEKSKTVELDQQ